MNRNRAPVESPGSSPDGGRCEAARWIALPAERFPADRALSAKELACIRPLFSQGFVFTLPAQTVHRAPKEGSPANEPPLQAHRVYFYTLIEWTIYSLILYPYIPIQNRKRLHGVYKFIQPSEKPKALIHD